MWFCLSPSSGYASALSLLFHMSEIDDIFAGKSKSKGKAKEAANTVPEAPLPSKKKKKKSKRVDAAEPLALEETPEVAPAPVAGTKRKLPETVVDPSLAVEAKAKRVKDGGKEGKKSKATAQAENSDDERFRDSRGTGPSESPLGESETF
jgi:hypothetical protein